MLKTSAFRRYLVGLLATFLGAGFTNQTGSMWPLALGASASILCTVPLVIQLWNRQRNSRQ